MGTRARGLVTSGYLPAACAERQDMGVSVSEDRGP